MSGLPLHHITLYGWLAKHAPEGHPLRELARRELRKAYDEAGYERGPEKVVTHGARLLRQRTGGIYRERNGTRDRGWRVQIGRRHVGYFPSFHEAEKARDAALLDERRAA